MISISIIIDIYMINILGETSLVDRSKSRHQINHGDINKYEIACVTISMPPPPGDLKIENEQSIIDNGQIK